MGNTLALVDANSFFCACEQRRNPKLKNKPLAVLSNNDACFVSLTPQAKALGLKVGMPLFKAQDIVRRHRVFCLSANFEDYLHTSKEMMEILENFTPEVERYSIDEAFLNLNGFERRDLYEYALKINKKIQEQLDLSVSIGLASTKVLCKLANMYAKKEGRSVVDFRDYQQKTLQQKIEQTPIGEIWGIGNKLCKKLNSYGIFTVQDFLLPKYRLVLEKIAAKNLRQIQQELQGISCGDFLPKNNVKSIQRMRTFAQKITTLSILKKLLAQYIEDVTRQLRAHKMLAGGIRIDLRTSQHAPAPLVQSESINLTAYRCDNEYFLTFASAALEKNFRPEVPYRQLGVTLYNLKKQGEEQGDLFNPKKDTQENLMKVMDEINLNFGGGTLRSAATGLQDIKKVVTFHHREESTQN